MGMATTVSADPEEGIPENGANTHFPITGSHPEVAAPRAQQAHQWDQEHPADLAMADPPPAPKAPEVVAGCMVVVMAVTIMAPAPEEADLGTSAAQPRCIKARPTPMDRR